MAHASCLNIQDYYRQQSAEVFFQQVLPPLKKRKEPFKSKAYGGLAKGQQLHAFLRIFLEESAGCQLLSASNSQCSWLKRI